MAEKLKNLPKLEDKFDDDWRLNGQEEYIYGVELDRVRLRFPEPEEVDHAHCDFCWAKFSDREEDLHQGYATLDRQFIICDECFEDFKERFKWKVRNHKK